MVRSADSQDPSHSSRKVQDRVTRETSPVPSSGTESCLLPKQNEPQTEFHGEETRIKHAMRSVKPQEQKRKRLKEKGTSSILRFFQSRNSCSSSKQEHFESVREIKASSCSGVQSIGESCHEMIKDQLPQETPVAEIGTNSGTYSLGQDEQRRDAWSYKMDEIDPKVVNELPPEIQEELWAWLRPHKRPNIAKRGSSIAHYFSPAKST